MDRTDIISTIVALAGLAVLYLFFRNRESKPGGRGRNFLVLAAILLAMAVMFGLDGR